jgi:hypothetical protein
MKEYYAIAGVVGIVTGIGGMIIGYYRSETSLARNYISKADCKECVMKVEVSTLAEAVKLAAKDLRQGAKTFTDLRIDMALVKQKLNISEDKISRTKIREQLENNDD